MDVTDIEGGDPRARGDENRRRPDGIGGSGYETRMPDYAAVRARELAGMDELRRNGRVLREKLPEKRMQPRLDQRIQCPENGGLDHAWAQGSTWIGTETVREIAVCLVRAEFPKLRRAWAVLEACQTQALHPAEKPG